MTFSEAVEEVFIAVNGGVLSSGAAVQRAEIEVYLPGAIADAFATYVSTSKFRAKRAGEAWSLPDNLFAEYELNLTKNAAGIYTAALPGHVLSMSTGRQVTGVYTSSGTEFCFATSLADARNYPVPAVWLIDNETATEVCSLCKIDCALYVRAILLWSCDVDGRIRAPEEVIVSAIDRASQFFGAEKQSPKDDINDKTADK